jgi:hypothetical protein
MIDRALVDAIARTGFPTVAPSPGRLKMAVIVPSMGDLRSL